MATDYEELPDDPIEPEPEPDYDEVDRSEVPQKELDETDSDFVVAIVNKLMLAMEHFTKRKMRPYQNTIARRLFESLIIEDAEVITALISRQGGKTEVIANVVVTAMVFFPKLALAYPEWFGKYDRGIFVGIFAPVEDQAKLMYGRVVTYLTSPRATEILLDLDDKARTDGAKRITLRNSGSFCKAQTCNPKAQIEGATYHLIIIDEAQGAEDEMVNKSIFPMGSDTAATKVMIGTPNRTKNIFYKAIQASKRRQTRRNARQNHFEYDYKTVIKYNPRYKIHIDKERSRIGEDSDEFRMSYSIKWLLDRGMFVTEDRLESIMDPTLQINKFWYHTPVVVGIDPARTKDSTVVTVVAVDWEHPDEMGYYTHFILNWLEINNEEWEDQYYQIVSFLSNYNVYKVAVDAQGVGGAVAERLARLMPRCEVLSMDSTGPAQNERWVHLQTLIQRTKLIIPGHSHARRMKVWRRFKVQMEDLEKIYRGPYLLAEAPNEIDAHDDFADSLALACCLTIDDIMPEVEISSRPLYA